MIQTSTGRLADVYLQILENYLVHKAEQITAVLENGKEVLQPLMATKMVKSWKRVIDKRLRCYTVWSGRR